jgi:hypothetical protein
VQRFSQACSIIVCNGFILIDFLAKIGFLAKKKLKKTQNELKMLYICAYN